MAVFFYTWILRLYRLVILSVSPFHAKAHQWFYGRKYDRKKLAEFQRGPGKWVWFHAASLGEFEQGRPVMEALKVQEPETRILLTFFSPSGYEIRKNYPGADMIYYLPLDTPANARRFVERFRPDKAVFIKYEFWYHYLHELKARQIPTYLISAIFRPEQPFFKWWGGFHRKMLACFTRFFVQDDVSVQLLERFGFTQTTLAGDTRFDRVKQIADQAAEVPGVDRFCGGKETVVCGSTWPGDEELLFHYINDADDHRQWIIVPHEIGESHLREIEGRCRKGVLRYSAGVDQLTDQRVLLVDKIGLLSSIYRYGSVAYIGGGFGQGIHNTLEAAVYGMPVVFGPRYHKFREATSLLEKGGGFSVKSYADFAALFDSFSEHPAIVRAAGKQAAAYVESQLGATGSIIGHLL